MVEPLRHRQTKEAATDMFDLKQLRHTSTLPFTSFPPSRRVRFAPRADANTRVYEHAPCRGGAMLPGMSDAIPAKTKPPEQAESGSVKGRT